MISGNWGVFNEFGSSKIFLHRLRMTKGVGVSPITATFACVSTKTGYIGFLRVSFQPP